MSDQGKWQKDASDQNFDYMFKILIIGNSSVGKTSFLFRYADDSFTSAFVSTVGIDFKVKTVFRQDKRVKLQIWVSRKMHFDLQPSPSSSFSLSTSFLGECIECVSIYWIEFFRKQWPCHHSWLSSPLGRVVTLQMIYLQSFFYFTFNSLSLRRPGELMFSSEYFFQLLPFATVCVCVVLFPLHPSFFIASATLALQVTTFSFYSAKVLERTNDGRCA